MAYFEGQAPNAGWQQSHRRQQSQPAFDQNQVMSPSVHTPTTPNDDGSAFGSQFEEIARASDNLMKSGRTFGTQTHARRESAPMNNFSRQFAELDPRFYGPQRPNAVSDYDGMRSHSSHSSSSVQGYIANQRFGPRQSEAEQVMQAKRRAAAQRERELRNYHQEQQYNRNVSSAKSDRSMSPNAMNEEDRRDLIARQHRALYGEGSNLYMSDGSSPRGTSQDARVLAATSSGQTPPIGFDSYGSPGTSSEASLPMQSIAPPQPRTRTESISSKSPNPNSFALFESNQQTNRTSSSSPGEEQQARQGAAAPGSGGVAPIGTRPAQPNNQGNRKTPPMPSPLSYGLGNDKNAPSSNERSQSASSNPSNQQSSGTEKSVNLGWGGSSGPWGSSKNLGVQASVWG